MAEIAVCIPAYRAASFIHHTLASVRSQTFQDFEVEIAIEPADAEATLSACAPFLEDPRFRARVNLELLGYAGNVRALLWRVRAPLFVVLPHDDTWHPHLLERLHDTLRDRSDAVCAYPDVLCFAPDGQDAGVITQQIDDASLPDRILSWLLDGATGTPWHGLTRSIVLEREFPSNPHRGFAVEAEWALSLLVQGPVLRVAEPLYLKRMPTTSDSVSASWSVADEELLAALDHHREQLLLSMPDTLSLADRRAVVAAAEAAMLRRSLEFSRGRWGLTARQLQTAADLLKGARRLEPTIAARVTATVRWALSRHWDAAGDLEAAEREVRKGLIAVPDDVLLCTQLGWLLAARDAVLEAVEIGLSASRAHSADPGVRSLLRYCESRLEHDLRPLADANRGREAEAPALATPGQSVHEDGPEEEPMAGISMLRRRLQLQEAATQAAERRVLTAEQRAQAAESQAVLLAAEHDRMQAEQAAVAAAIQDAMTSQAGLGNQIDMLVAEAQELRQRVSEAAVLAAALGEQGGWRTLRRRLARRRRQVLVRLGLPNPLFDAAWYRETYPDVGAGRLRAWLHWRRHGWREGRDPNPLFDTDWYLATYSDIRASGTDPLAHYLLHGSAEGRDPGPMFDARAYLERYPDVRMAGLDPLLHYQRFGGPEGRLITRRRDPG